MNCLYLPRNKQEKPNVLDVSQNSFCYFQHYFVIEHEDNVLPLVTTDGQKRQRAVKVRKLISLHQVSDYRKLG